jgi:hypothetical protein
MDLGRVRGGEGQRAERRKRLAAVGARRPLGGRRQVPPLEGGDEPISTPWQRLDVAGRVGLVAEGGPDLLDAEVQPLVEVNERVAAPDLAAQLLAGDHVTRSSDEEREDLERLLLELDKHAALAQLAVAEIDLEHPEAHERPLARSIRRDARGGLGRHLFLERLVPCAAGPDEAFSAD